MASSHNKATSSLRNLLSNSRKVPPYSPNRIYGNRSKKNQPKRLCFEVTLFNFPGESIIKKQIIEEKELEEIGSGSLLLLENHNVLQVKEELVKLVNTFLEECDHTESVNFIFMKREGRKKQFKKHHCSSSFQYDALGLKDLTGRDSKKLFVILSSKVPSINYPAPRSKLVTPIFTVSDGLSDDELPFSPMSPASSSISSHNTRPQSNLSWLSEKNVEKKTKSFSSVKPTRNVGFF